MIRKFGAGLLCFCLSLLLIAGCNMPQKVTVPPTPTQEELPEDTPVPTETPTPLPVREKLVFLLSDEVPGVTESLSRAMEQVCAAYDCETAANEDAIPQDADFVIFAKAPTALSSLTQRFPSTRFVVVDEPTAVYDGVWTIQYDEAFLPFLAGLATASNAYDWRSAGLLPNDSLLWGTHAEEAFANGAHYMCGNCRPSLSPYVEFPLVISLPGDSSPDLWSSQFDEAQRSFIYTAFLSDEAISEALLQKMVTLNVQLLGVSAPPEGLEGNWLATINFDWADTLQQIISRTLSGEMQGTQPLILSITPGALSEEFSEGKANVLRRAYDLLLSGFLSPYTATKEYTE